MEREERERGETERDEYGLEMGKLESMKETEFLGSEEEEGEVTYTKVFLPMLLLH